MKSSKLFSYLAFALGSIVVVVAFLTAKNYTQLGIAILLYPVVTVFAFLIFPRRKKVAQQVTIANTAPQAALVGTPAYATPVSQSIVTQEDDDIEDSEKRSFLKIVGAMGVALFLSSLLGERVGGLLFGKMNGTQPLVNPSPNPSPTVPGASPTDGYKITEADEEDVVSYYGFTNDKGGWIIMRNDTENNSFRYAKGSTSFPGNWDGRVNLKYDYFFNLK